MNEAMESLAIIMHLWSPLAPYASRFSIKKLRGMRFVKGKKVTEFTYVPQRPQSVSLKTLCLSFPNLKRIK